MMKKIPKSNGQAVISIVIFFLIISLAVLSAAVIPTSNQIAAIGDLYRAKQGFIAADSVNDETFYRLNKGLTLPASVTLPFSTSSTTATAQVTTSAGVTTINTTGTNDTTTRYDQSVFEQSSGTSFSYGLQVGTGGISLAGGSTINGSVYSDGNITGDTSVNTITGSATAANQSNPVADQTNSYTGSTTPLSVNFGNTSTSEGAAQGFKASTTTALTSVRLYLKKVGTPSNATVIITNDNSGKPGSTTLGSGTLNASTVTSSFGYITIPISPTPALSLNTQYWIVINYTTYSSSNYYISAATNNTYSNGIAMTGTYSTNNNKNVWNNASPSGADLYFDTYVGGNTSIISGGSANSRLNIGSGGVGTAWADQVNNSSVASTIYCQSGTGIYNQSNVSQVCNVSRADPTPLSYPISDANITEWKSTASAGGTQSGNYSVSGGTTVSMGPKEIIGNLTVTSGSTLSLTGPVWVTGTITLNGGSTINLASSAGSGSGMIISDNTITVSGGGHFNGSGTSGSYLVAITTNTSSNAINISGGSGSVVLYAPYGTVSVSGGASANSIVANQINLSGGSSISYQSGLTNVDFVNGPSGSFKVDSWGEVSQ